MSHLADGMTELCQCGKHKNSGGECIPMYYSSREEAYSNWQKYRFVCMPDGG